MSVFDDLKGKKLLMLGGQGQMKQVVETARSMGIYAIVADYHTDFKLSPAKEIADETWEVSWNDIDSLEAKCRESKVDGVFAGFGELRVRAGRLLSDRMGYPFYAGLEQIDLLRDKEKFKLLCRSYGVDTVEEYTLSSDPSREELDALVYPVVLKPTDMGGSRGISVCYDEEQLLNGIKKALSYSASNSIIAERYMDAQEVNVSYTIQEGEVSLSCVSDAIPGHQSYGSVKLTDGWLFPSKYLREYTETADERVRRMLKGAGVENGFFFVTCFYQDSRFYMFDPGFRLGGGTTYNFISYNNEINYLKMMIAHSLTGKMAGWSVKAYDDPFFKRPCCNLTVMVKPGTIGHVGDLNALQKMDGVLSLDTFYSVGQEVPESNDLRQAFARVNIVADDADMLAKRIGDVYALLDIRDDKGRDMLLSSLKEEFIRAYWA